jgi:hypothetical protein
MKIKIIINLFILLKLSVYSQTIVGLDSSFYRMSPLTQKKELISKIEAIGNLQFNKNSGELSDFQSIYGINSSFNFFGLQTNALLQNRQINQGETSKNNFQFTYKFDFENYIANLKNNFSIVSPIQEPNIKNPIISKINKKILKKVLKELTYEEVSHNHYRKIDEILIAIQRKDRNDSILTTDAMSANNNKIYHWANEHIKTKTWSTIDFDSFHKVLLDSFSLKEFDNRQDDLSKQAWQRLQNNEHNVFEPNIDDLIVKFSRYKSLDSLFQTPAFLKEEYDYHKQLNEKAIGNEIKSKELDSLNKKYAQIQKLKQELSNLKNSKYLQSILAKSNLIDEKYKKESDQLGKMNNKLNSKKELLDQAPLSFAQRLAVNTNKFNIGQAQLDFSKLTFQNNLMNGINIEIDRPIYLFLVGSFPIKQNLFTDFISPSQQDNKYSTIGLGIGNSQESKLATKIGFFQLDNFSQQVKSQQETMNQKIKILSWTNKFNISKLNYIEFEIAKSETKNSRRGFSNSLLRFDKNGLEQTAIMVNSEWAAKNNFWKLKLQASYIGNQYQNVTNPMIYKGIASRVGLTLNFSKKLSLRSNSSYRQNQTSDTMNNLTIQSTNSLSYKLKKMRFTATNTIAQTDISQLGLSSTYKNYVSALSMNANTKIAKKPYTVAASMQHSLIRNQIQESTKDHNQIYTINCQQTITLDKTNVNLSFNNTFNQNEITNIFQLQGGTNFSPSSTLQIGIQTSGTLQNNRLDEITLTGDFNYKLGKFNLRANLSQGFNLTTQKSLINSQLGLGYRIL